VLYHHGELGLVLDAFMRDVFTYSDSSAFFNVLFVLCTVILLQFCNVLTRALVLIYSDG
jgi:hypothetical protein